MANSSPTSFGEARGAGGKLKKPSRKPPPATPYSRPLATPSGRGGGWLSKVLDPACRVIAGGATMIFPSIFSKSPSPAPPLLPVTVDHVGTNERDVRATSTATDDAEGTSDYLLTRSNKEEAPSEIHDRIRRNSEIESDSDVFEQEKPTADEDSEIARIEQIVKGKVFSRDEIDRLTEILKSRAVDCSDETKENSSMTSKGILVARDIPIKSGEERRGEKNRTTVGFSTPLVQKSTQDEVGASPVDVARAFMRSRISEQDPGLCSSVSEVKGDVQPHDEYALKSIIPPLSPKQPTCWPGAMAQDQRGYLTPESRGARYGLHDFPRTPYSRTIFSKSRTKAQTDSRNPTSSLHQTRMPTYAQGKSKSDMLDAGYGSVGPVRRIRNKYASEARSRGSIFLSSSKAAPSSSFENSNLSKGFFPSIQKTLETGAMSGMLEHQQRGHVERSSEENIPGFSSSSSEAVRKILEHLDRHKPTPKEKADELKLVTECKSTNFPTVGGNSRGDSNIFMKPQQRVSSGVIDASPRFSADSITTNDAKAGSSIGPNSTPDFQLRSSYEAKSGGGPNVQQNGTIQGALFPGRINGKDIGTSSSMISKPSKQHHSTGTRPPLPSISSNRPAVSFDNGVGFTFPVSATPGTFPELPTPSITPASSKATSSRPGDVLAVPSYSFGAEISTPRLVFSFPTTSTASMSAEASDPKFSFGSDKERRLTFSSVGKIPSAVIT